MSVLNQSGEEQVECPLCMEPLEVDDLHFYPCTCGYQICRFCWNRIREGENGLCPACRKAYPENPADFTPLSQEQVAAIKTEKKAREQKRRNKTLESRRALANVRVVQNNLVFVVGLPVRLADPEILKRQEYFGKYGKIHKVVINQSTTYAGSQGPSASAYVTYVSPADALRAIQGVNNVTLDGRVLKGSLGTTKYCANFMKNQPCPKPDCMYLHELGDPKASFTKEEMHAGLHQVYERKLHNQLLAAQKENSSNNSSGNSSTNADKSNTAKEGNPSNYIPTTVVTSSHTNVVNSSKANKKESVNGTGSGTSSSSSNGNSNGNSSGNGNSNGKEAWPSLGSSPPTDSPARQHHSPHHNHIVSNKSQENGTSESSSPTLHQTQQNQAQNKSKETDSSKQNKKENSTNGQASKKSKNDKQNKNQIKQSNSVSNDSEPEPQALDISKQFNNSQTHSVFENDTQQYLSNELDELESDRHSLLENHDLLDNSDHSLLDDDNTHNLLNDANNDVIMMQRHREMLAGLVDNNHLLQMKSPLVNGYGLSDRDMEYNRQMSQMSQSLLEKELALRERSRSELLMRHGELLARYAMPEHKYMPAASIAMDSASELLGANLYPNPQILPPFGMRVNPPELGSVKTGVTGGSQSAAPFLHALHAAQSHAAQSLAPQSHAPQSHPVHSHMHQPLVNGFDAPHQPIQTEGRYVAENMDKFFTDFHKAQQMRVVVSRAGADARFLTPRNMLSAERLEMEHKHRMNNMRSSENPGHRAAGDGDDDLDFDPFKETQKALAEMMETEMMQNSVSSGDNVRRSRMAPPGFSHVNTYGIGMPRQHPQQHQGFNSGSAMFTDWTQMDPAIMSTSVPGGAGPGKGVSSLSHHQQELFARFNHLALHHQPNGLAKIQVPMTGYGSVNVSGASGMSGTTGMTGSGASWGAVPPGFAPPHAPLPHAGHSHPARPHPAECIDAK